MNRLRQRIRDTILQDGPMPVSLYMAMCLHDPVDGYYATRPGLGRDFITAPEVSQVFGELLGAWVAHEWRAMGRPSPFQLVELGPGRGVMIADMLRAASKAPGFGSAVRVMLVEASPALRALQLQRLQDSDIRHVKSLTDLGPEPAIIVANEFLDCLPIRQFVKRGDAWHERCVGLAEDGESFRFGLGGPASAPSGTAENATETEVASGMDALVADITDVFATRDGRALFIDYGPAHATPGDTLRAFENGQQVDPLARPGECDLTADVDFARVSATARTHGLALHGPVTQGAFLEALGAGDRFTQLAAKNPHRTMELHAAHQRLVDPKDMGERFKVICLTPAGAPAPPGFDGASNEASAHAS